LEAEIVLVFNTRKQAEAVAKAVSPDNRKIPPHLKIKTVVEGNRVRSIVKCKGKFESFLATIDDLLMCAQAADKSITAIRSK